VIARAIGAGHTPPGQDDDPACADSKWVLVIRDVTRERESQERLRQQDRLAVIGQLVGESPTTLTIS
jgi:hypothetical protein